MSDYTPNQPPIPYGYCQCGCGQQTKIAVNNDAKTGSVRGKPNRFIHGHAARKPDSMHPPEGQGWCRDCRQVKPKNEFSPDNRRLSGIQTICKDCAAIKKKQHRTIHPEKQKENDRRHYLKCRDKILQQKKDYHKRNRVKRSAYEQEYHNNNREKIKQSGQRYRQTTEYKILKRTSGQRRAARMRRLPADFTANDWKRALDYFHGCCAVCSRQLNDLFKTHIAAMDHWIPLSNPNCPGTVTHNIVPLCNGVGGCNNSKNDKDAFEWMVKRFGRSFAKRKLKEISAYFEQVKRENSGSE